MPQMAPISWLFLFLIFSITFIMFNIMNYYSFFYFSSNQANNFLKNQKSPLSWKW